MKYQLKTDNFFLGCELQVFESDIKYPSNTVMQISVSSSGFSGESSMDIDVKQFAVFSAELLNIYDTLTGAARIDEPYGEQFIQFSGNGLGLIQVKGYLIDNSANGCIQKLNFENEFDQTYLKDFSHMLYDAYYNY